MPFGVKKTRMVWLPDGEKISKISLFVLAQFTNVSDGQTDRQTPHDDIGRAFASHCAAKIVQCAVRAALAAVIFGGGRNFAVGRTFG